MDFSYIIICGAKAAARYGKGYALRSVFGKNARQTNRGEGDISPFSALTTALAATIGTGNIWFVNLFSAIFNCAVFSVIAFVGAAISLEIVWNFSDVMNGLMAFPNLISLIALSGVAAKADPGISGRDPLFFCTIFQIQCTSPK